MKKIFQAVFILSLTSIISGCIMEYRIQISENGISNVEITSHQLNKKEILEYDSTAGPAADFFQSDELSKNNQIPIGLDSIKYWYQHSTVITDFKAISSEKVHFKSSFTVLNLDSLGSYLSPLYELSNPLHYLSRDSFKIECPPFRDSLAIMEYGSCMFIEMNYVLPYEIVNAYSTNSWIDVSFHKRNLFIKTRVDRHNFAKNSSAVIAIFE